MSALVKMLFCFLLFIPFVQAQSPVVTQATALSFEDAFSQGSKNYQEKNFEEAIKKFQRALDLHPDSVPALTNLGLAYFQMQNKGMATAMLRRALFVDPHAATAQAGLKFVTSQLEIKEIPHQLETYERVRSNFLTILPLSGFNVLTLLLLFSSGFVWLRFVGRRRKAFALEEAPPGVPWIGVLLLVGFVFCASLTLLKAYDLSIPRATIVVDKVSAQTAPGEGQTALFDLYAGFEVIVRSAEKDWIQITYPGGLTGWVKKDSLLATSGDF